MNIDDSEILLKQRLHEACKNLNPEQIKDSAVELKKLDEDGWLEPEMAQDANGNSPLQSIILQSNKGVLARVGFSKARTLITDTINTLKSARLLFLDNVNNDGLSALDLLNSLSAEEGYSPYILSWIKKNQELAEAKTAELIRSPWLQVRFTR